MSSKSLLAILFAITITLAIPVSFAIGLDQGTGGSSCLLTNQGTCGVMVPLYTRSPLSYIKYSTELFTASSADPQYPPGWVNFTAVSFGTPGAPAHAFAASVASGNASIGPISPDTATSVLYTLQCKVTTTCYAYFQYPSGYTMTDVIVNTGSSSQTVLPGYFVTTRSAFNIGSSGTVLYTASNRTIEVKVSYASPSTVQFDWHSSSSSQGGGNPPPPTSTSTITTIGTATTSTSTSIIQGIPAGLLTIFLVLVVAAIGIINRRNRRPNLRREGRHPKPKRRRDF